MSKNKDKKCNSSIKCDVESCKYQDKDKECCTLDEIQVACTCDNDECDCSNDTVCASYDLDEEKISNNGQEEYDVEEEDDDDDDEYEESELENS